MCLTSIPLAPRVFTNPACGATRPPTFSAHTQPTACQRRCMRPRTALLRPNSCAQAVRAMQAALRACGMGSAAPLRGVPPLRHDQRNTLPPASDVARLPKHTGTHAHACAHTRRRCAHHQCAVAGSALQSIHTLFTLLLAGCRHMRGCAQGPRRPIAVAVTYETGTTSFSVMRSYTSRTLRPTIVCAHEGGWQGCGKRGLGTSTR